MTEHYSRRRFLAGAGAVGATALAGCTGGGGDDGEEDGEETTDETTTDGGDDGAQFEQTDYVEMTDDLTFEPKHIEVEAGTTVTWETTGSVGHTVTAYEAELPDGAEYFASGGFDSEQAAVDAYNDDQSGNVAADETYEFTFETTGTHEYYCIPHEMNGMVGSVKVI